MNIIKINIDNFIRMIIKLDTKKEKDKLSKLLEKQNFEHTRFLYRDQNVKISIQQP
jgi:hypothetical protein